MAIAGVMRPKQASEQLTPSINFTPNLFGGSVQSATATARNIRTGADVTATILTGSPIVNSPFVTVTVIGGTAGDVYAIEVVATMSGGQIVEDEIIIPMARIP